MRSCSVRVAALKYPNGTRSNLQNSSFDRALSEARPRAYEPVVACEALSKLLGRRDSDVFARESYWTGAQIVPVGEGSGRRSSGSSR